VEEGVGNEVERRGRGDLAGVVVADRDGGEGRFEELGSDVEEDRQRNRWAVGLLVEEREGVGTGCAGEGGVEREIGVAGGLEEEVVESEDPEGRRSTRRSPARVREWERYPRLESVDLLERGDRREEEEEKQGKLVRKLATLSLLRSECSSSSSSAPRTAAALPPDLRHLLRRDGTSSDSSGTILSTAKRRTRFLAMALDVPFRFGEIVDASRWDERGPRAWSLGRELRWEHTEDDVGSLAARRRTRRRREERVVDDSSWEWDEVLEVVAAGTGVDDR